MSHLPRIAASVLRVGLRRRRNGPFHPEWGLLLEATVDYLRGEGERQLAGTLAEWRRNQEISAKSTPAARGVRISDGTLAGRSTLDLVPSGAPRGTILYLHGGGYVTGSPRTHRGMVSHIVAASGARAVLLDYRLAPEFPFPSAIEDAVAAIDALYASGVAPAQLVVMGDSAGGGLAVAAMNRLRDSGKRLPGGAALLCPWVDLEGTTPSVVDNARFDWGDRRTLDFYAHHYAAGRLRDPEVSPIHASLHGLPPLLIQSGGAELVRDECRMLAENARRDGVRVEAHEYPGMVHDFQLFTPLVPQSRAAIAELGEFVRRVVG